MSKLNHQRPYLQLLNNFRRENGQSSSPASNESGTKSELLRNPWPWESISPPTTPREDGQLLPQHVVPLEELLSLNRELVVANGIASRFFGKANSKKKLRLSEAESGLIDGGVVFLRYCAVVAQTGSLEPWHWIQNYCNSHRRNGNRLFDSIAGALMGASLERFFWWSLQDGDDDDKARLIAFVKLVSRP